MAHPTWRDISHTIAQDWVVGYNVAPISILPVLRHRSIQTLEEACDQVDVLSHCEECSAECRICKSGSHCLEEGLVECNPWWGAGCGAGARILGMDEKYAQAIIDSFGDRLTTLARPVWKIQVDALSRTDFTQ